MRTVVGVMLGLALVFPGILLLQWITAALGLYDDVTFTDGCLAMIIILLSVLLLRGGLRTDASDARGTGLAGQSSKSPRSPRRPQGPTRP